MLNKAQSEADQLIGNVRSYFGKNASNFRIVDLSDEPFDIFTLYVTLYNIHEAKLVYDRSTLGINLKVDEQFIGLSRLTSERVYRGFDACIPENLIHNFEVLDEILKKK